MNFHGASWPPHGEKCQPRGCCERNQIRNFHIWKRDFFLFSIWFHGKRNCKIETLVVGCPPAWCNACFSCAHSCTHATASEVQCEKIKSPGFLHNFFFVLRSMQMMHNNNGASTYLLQYRSDVLQRQRRKLILLQEVVQVLLEHLKHQACVVLVLKALEGPHKVEFVSIFLAEAWQDGDLNLTLTRVGWMILENFDGDDVAGALFPALHHLAERAATEKLQNLKSKREELIKNKFERSLFFYGN